MLGARTMIQETIDRLGDLAPPERVFVATTERLAGQIAAHLPELPPRRDHRRALQAGHRSVHRPGGDPRPSRRSGRRDGGDAVGPRDPSRRAIPGRDSPGRLAGRGGPGAAGHVRHPADLSGRVVRLHRARRAAGVARGRRRARAGRVSGPAVPREARGRRRPGSISTAGTFYWNSGIFVWKASTILDAIGRFQPRLREHLDRIADAADAPDVDDVLRREFEAIEPISIDRGVMEHAEDVVVIEAPFDWDDVGSWRALERLREADPAGNVIDAPRHVGINTTGTIVRARGKDHVVVTVGVNDLIVIVTPDATLVANKNDEESIRQVTRELEERGWREYL